jgi:hypothetical protein
MLLRTAFLIGNLIQRNTHRPHISLSEKAVVITILSTTNSQSWGQDRADREFPHQNQSLRYATHQLKMPMGIVARSDHKMGKVKSAVNPSATKVAQKTLRCIPIF